MHGVNFARVVQILGHRLFFQTIFGRNGALQMICKQLQKACLENDIEMVKALLRTIAAQDVETYNEIDKILQESLTPEEYSELKK